MANELPPDLSADELDQMVADLAREMGCPDRAYSPDLVELDHIPGHIYGYNRGCNPDGLEIYVEGQKWRRKVIQELGRRPDWIAEWRAARELNRQIRELCEAKGLEFYPFECPPWDAPDELSPDFQTDWGWARSLPAAVKLRRKLIAEIKAGA